MEYNEFAERIKSKYPEYNDMDNMELARKMVNKYPNEYADITFEQPQKRGIDLTPSGLVKQGVAGTLAPVRAGLYHQTLPEAYNTNMERVNNFKPLHGTGDFIVDTLGYMALPVLRGAKGATLAGNVGRFVGNALIQGGIPGILEGLKEGEPLQGAGVGTAIAGGVQTIPIAGKPVAQFIKKGLENPNFQKGISKILEVLTSVPSAYSKLAIENELAGKSIFEGAFDKDTAYIPIERKLRQAKSMLPTKEQFASEFNRLGNRALQGMQNIKDEAAQKINEVLGKLNANAVDINGLRNAVTGYVNSEAKGGNINNFIERAGGDIKDVYKKLGIKDKQQLTNELNNYYDTNLNANIEQPRLSKEQENIAFDVLAQATGKNKQWLKTQLNANLPKLSTQKRQEFIQNLLENTGDRVENIDPRWRNYFPELTVENMGDTTATDIANNMFDKIMSKDFRRPNLSPADMEAQEIGKLYNSILSDLTQNPTKYAQEQALKKIENSTLGNDAKAYLYEKFANDVDNIDNIVNPKIKPIDLHNIKEGLYDKANYETEKYGIRNTALKGIANQVNNYLRNIAPAYKAPNDMYSLIMDVERGLDGENTIARKIKGIGSEANQLTGLDTRLKNIDNLLPNQNKFYKEAQEIINSEKEIDQIRNTIGQQYERNPRLLANRTDETFEQALKNLQKKTGVNITDELNKTRAREALENLFPGQGGGSGSSQGFGNLLRTAVLGGSPATALYSHSASPLLGLGVISPKLMGKGTIKNLGKIYRATGREIPVPIKRLLTISAIKANAPTLYGGINNDNYDY